MYKDAIITNCEQSEEIKKSERPSKAGHKDSEVIEDRLVKKDSCISSDLGVCGKNSSAAFANGCSSFTVETVEKSSLPAQSSPRSCLDDDATVPLGACARTLPGAYFDRSQCSYGFFFTSFFCS